MNTKMHLFRIIVCCAPRNNSRLHFNVKHPANSLLFTEEINGSTSCWEYLTNKKAWPAICSVVKKRKRIEHERGVHVRDSLRVLLSALLECSTRFLSALQKNRSKGRLLYLF